LGVLEEYAAGDIIYEQGNAGTKLYVLSKGQVSLVRTLKLDNKRTANATVYMLRESPGRRVMGGWCTLVGQEHIQMCTARCDKPTEVVSINSSGLRETMIRNVGIRVILLEKLVLILRGRMESSFAAMETL
jgi:CRP-like cAMP-binding protein